MKIYTFYLHDEIKNISQYHGLNESYVHIEPDGIFFSCFYAWTSVKSVRSEFKKVRNMNLFQEAVIELDSNDDINEFCDIYADVLVTEKPISTKTIINDRIHKITVLVLMTSNESDFIILHGTDSLSQEFSDAISSDLPFFDSHCFKGGTFKALQRLQYDELLRTIAPIEETIPWDLVDIDHLALYTHYFQNTYRKKVSAV